MIEMNAKWIGWLYLGGTIATLMAGATEGAHLTPAPSWGVAGGSDGQDTTMVCVVRDGQLVEVSATVHSQTGDTLVNGRPFAEAYPADAPHYLATAAWAANEEWVLYDRRRYVRYGTPRVLAPRDLVRVGEFRGIPLFARSADDAYRSLYLPTRPGCEFQLYHYNATVGEVRG
ncbi:MAG TPA: hypothetical protein VEY93_08060 [Longimicrobium sp.]|nr:hypothetical protein [Longimicrobium sp.]